MKSNGHQTLNRNFSPLFVGFLLVQETLLHRNDAKPGSYHLRCVAGPATRWQGGREGWMDGWMRMVVTLDAERRKAPTLTSC